MSKLSKQSKKEMVRYIELLLKNGIYIYGTNMPFSINRIAEHLVSSGCRININSRRRKLFNEEDKNDIGTDT